MARSAKVVARVAAALLAVLAVQTQLALATSSNNDDEQQQRYHQRLVRDRQRDDYAASSAAAALAARANLGPRWQPEPTKRAVWLADISRRQSNSSESSSSSSTSSSSSSSSTTSRSSSTSSTSDSHTSSTTSQSSSTTSREESSTTTPESSSTTSQSSSTSRSSSSQVSASVVIVTVTLGDGSVVTSPIPSQSSTTSSDSGSNSKAWIIPLSVVGGVLALAGFLFMAYRCTQRRFSEIDDEDGHAIRWPELLKRSEEETTTLNPLGTKRREGAAGFDMDETKSVASEQGIMSSTARNDSIEALGGAAHRDHFVAAGLGIPDSHMMSRHTSSSESSSSGGAGYYMPPSQQQHAAYYDPFMGASGAPYPPPARSLSPGPNNMPYYDPATYNGGVHPDATYYPPQPAHLYRRPSATLIDQYGSGAQPQQQQGGYAQHSQAQAYSPSLGHQSNHSDADMSQMARPISPVPQAIPRGLDPHKQPTFRLSIANPDKDD